MKDFSTLRKLNFLGTFEAHVVSNDLRRKTQGLCPHKMNQNKYKRIDQNRKEKS